MQELLELNNPLGNTGEMEVTNFDEANRFVRCEYHDGWSLDV